MRPMDAIVVNEVKRTLPDGIGYFKKAFHGAYYTKGGIIPQ